MTQRRQMVAWAEQLPTTAADAAASSLPRRTLFYRSIRIQQPPSLPVITATPTSAAAAAAEQRAAVGVYLLAYYVAHRRFYTIPLLLRHSVDDIDAYLRRNIHYSSVYNPYGSGCYTHWSDHHIIYFAAWDHLVVAAADNS